jgi:hypothetical protein
LAQGRRTLLNRGAETNAAGVDLAAMMLALGAVVLVLGSCSSIGHGPSGAIYGSACQPFDPDITHSCVISSERWSEIAETPEPPGMYRYCAWPGLLSGDYRTRYRDVEGTIHDFTEAPAQTPSFLLEELKGADNSPTTDVVDYRMMPRTHPCPNAPP